MKSLTDTFQLRNKVEIPCIGYGTWKTPDGETASASVRTAIEMGYRHIDTDRQRAAFGLPFFVRFCPAQAGGLGGKRLCRALACPDFYLRQGADRPGKQRERSQEKIF